VPQAPHVARVMSFSRVHAEHFQVEGVDEGVEDEYEEVDDEDEDEDEEPFLGTSHTTQTVELARFSA